MENVSLFKIAFNTHHILHPGTDNSERYARWNKTGILTFALAAIFTGGLAALVIFGTAFAKYNRIKKLKQDSENANKVDALAEKAGLKGASNGEEKAFGSSESSEVKPGVILEQQLDAQKVAKEAEAGLKDAAPKPLSHLDRAHLCVQFTKIQDKNALYAQCLKTYRQDDLLSLLYDMRLKNEALPDAAKPFIVEVTPKDFHDSLEKVLKRDLSQVKFLRVQGPIFNDPAPPGGILGFFGSKPEPAAQPISTGFVKSIFKNCENLEHLTLDNCGLDNDDRLLEMANLLKEEGGHLRSLSLTRNNLRNKDKDEPLKGFAALRDATQSLANLVVIDLSNNKLSGDLSDYLGFSKQDRELRLFGNPLLQEVEHYQIKEVNFYEGQIVPLRQRSERILVSLEGNFHIIKDCFCVAVDAKKCTQVNSESLKELFSQKLLVNSCSIQESNINDEALIACINDLTPEKTRALNEINFDSNQITDVGGVALANSIKSAKFPNLSKLSLKANQISEDGKKALREAVASKDKFTLDL